MQGGTTLAAEPVNEVSIQRIWAELTGKCQLTCTHCYADSGPFGGHGRMTARNWMNVVDDAQALGAFMVQFIGGCRRSRRVPRRSCRVQPTLTAPSRLAT